MTKKIHTRDDGLRSAEYTMSEVVKKVKDSMNVDKPSHYTQAKIECIDALEAATTNKTGIEAVCVANVIKYLWRYEAKGKPLEDVKKARWYLNKLVQRMEAIDEEESKGKI